MNVRRIGCISGFLALLLLITNGCVPQAVYDQCKNRNLIAQEKLNELMDEKAIWSGSPQGYPVEAMGVLSVSGEGFSFIDPVPLSALEGAASLTYSLNAVTDDGFAFNLEALDGPGDLKAHLNAGPLLALDPAWPNPANPAVTVRFRAAPVENISVRIMDLRGRLVRELYQGAGTGDWQHIIWNGKTDQGIAAASGLYLIRLENGQKALSQRVVLAR